MPRKVTSTNIDKNKFINANEIEPGMVKQSESFGKEPTETQNIEVRIDGTTYQFNKLSNNAQKLIISIQNTQEEIARCEKLLNVLMFAKNNYLQALKQNI